MVPISEETSNQLFDTFAEWDTALTHHFPQFEEPQPWIQGNQWWPQLRRHLIRALVKKYKKRPASFSLRLSAEERAYLEDLAGAQPLGSYIREQLLGEKIKKPKPLRRPRVNEEQISAVLAQLGGSRLSSNLNQLAKHANMGTLDITRNLEQELEDACKAVMAMRDALFIALGMRVQSGAKEQRKWS